MKKRFDKDRFKQAKKLAKETESELCSIDLASVPYVPPGMTRAFRNNRYTIMVYDNKPTTKGPATRVMIQNHFNTPIANHWSEIQKIKNKIFGENTIAIEYYPSQSDLIDDKNIYWIWVYPEGVLPIPINNAN